MTLLRLYTEFKMTLSQIREEAGTKQKQTGAVLYILDNPILPG